MRMGLCRSKTTKWSCRLISRYTVTPETPRKRNIYINKKCIYSHIFVFIYITKNWCNGVTEGIKRAEKPINTWVQALHLLV